MALTRVHIGLTAAQLKALDKFAQKLGLDRTNAIRYCISRTLEAEENPARVPAPIRETHR